ncbi:MAG: helix-turn-helix transcriptional regulator [Filifactoraceae bacterium]
MSNVNNLKKYRLEKGLTQQELADITGVGRSMIGSIEKNVRIGSKQTWDKLAKGLNVDVNDLINLEKPANYEAVGKELTKLLSDLDKDNLIEDVNNIDPITIELILKTIQKSINVVRNKKE